MVRTFVAGLVAAAVGTPIGLWGAQSQPAPARSNPGASTPSASTDVEKLPVSLSRIRRLLERSAESDRFENFRLLTSINVYGQAPRFELFSPDETGRPSSPGPVRYSGMTQSEFVSMVQPRDFRAPVMNLSGAGSSLGSWMAERRRKADARRAAEARRGEERSVQPSTGDSRARPD